MLKPDNKKLAALAAGVLIAAAAGADVSFIHVIEGTPLYLSQAKKVDPGTVLDPAAFDLFKRSGSNPYNRKAEAIEKGHSLYLSACSGCHGHEAEGKLGPGLADDYWTYPQNATDKGLFETLFGGAKGMMGPQYVNLGNDQMLLIMAWIRSIYQGDPKGAKWLRHADSACPPEPAKP